MQTFARDIQRNKRLPPTSANVQQRVNWTSQPSASLKDNEVKFTGRKTRKIVKLIMRSSSLELSRDGLDRILHDELIQVEQMRANPFASRICELFSEDGSGVLTFDNFLNMMAVFSLHTRPEVKMVWAFAMWDFDGDDVIGPGDIRYGLNLITCSGVTVNPSFEMLTRVPSAAGLEDQDLDGIVREAVKEVDPDGYGLGYHEFRAVLSRMPDFINNFRMSFWD